MKIVFIKLGLSVVLFMNFFGSPTLAEGVAPETSPDQAAKTVRLVLRAKGGGRPIRKVEIQVGPDKFFSDSEGVALIPLPIPFKEVTFVRAGFQTAVMSREELEAGSDLEIYLLPALGADDEVIVRGKRRPAVSRKIISSEEASRVAPGGDPGQITKLLPGVTTQPGRSEVTIRGSKPSDSVYFVDNIKVPFIYHAIGNLSVLPAAVIEDVEFSAGGFGPEYGDATGGVVVLKSKNDIPERAKTQFTLNIPFYSAIYHERPLSDSSGMYVGVRRSYLDLILPKVLPKSAGVTIVPYFRDYQGIYVSKNDSGLDKLTLLASADGLRATVPGELSSDESGNARFFVQTYFGAIAFERQRNLGDGWSYSTTPQLVYTDNKFEITDLKFRVRAQTLSVPTEFTKRISRDERFYIGADASWVPYIVTFYLPKFNADDPFYDVEEAPREKGEERGVSWDVSSWVARDFKLPNEGILTPGLRAFYFNLINRSSADPRLQYRQDVGGGNTFKAAVGQYSQYPRNGEPTKTFGNPNLRFPKATHYILGMETKWSDRWESDFQLFYKDASLMVRNDPVINYNNNGRMRSRGAELFLRRALTERWFGWASYTYSKTEERKDDASPWYTGSNDQTHVANLAGSYRMSATWDLGGRVGYHTGDAYTSKVGDAVYNSNLDKYQSRAANAINGSRLPNYNELSLFSSHDGLFDSWKSTVRWGVEYFWFTRQAYGAEPNYDYTKETYFKGVPPIPYLEVRGEF